MRSPWASPADPHMIGEMIDDFTENDLRDIERRRDEPPDEPYPRDEPEPDDVFDAPENPVIP